MIYELIDHLAPWIFFDLIGICNSLNFLQDDDDLSGVVDPFEVGPMDELMARARQKAELELDKKRQQHDEHIVPQSPTSKLSTPTPEGGDASSVNTTHRPAGFEDDFKANFAFTKIISLI